MPVSPFSLLLIASALALFPSPALSWPGKVIHIADGDTITVLRDGQQERIRLYGIDSPEKQQACSQKAREALAGLVAGKVVEIDHKGTDRYRRTVAIVTVDGQSANAELVRSGYAWVFRKYCKERFCKDWLALEADAKEQKKGMWADPDIIPPWEWRRKKK